MRETAKILPLLLLLSIALLIGRTEGIAASADRQKALILLRGGIAMAEDGRFDEAKQALRRAVHYDSTMAEAHFRLGFLHEMEDSLAAAKQDYARAVALDSTLAAARFNLGLLLAREGDYAKAIPEFHATIRMHPPSPLAPLPHYCLGTVYGLQGRIDEAIEEYRKALALDPNLAHAHNELGRLYLRQGRLPDAVASLQRAVALDSTLAAARYNLSTAYARAGRRAAAAAEMQKFKELEAQRGRSPEDSIRWRP